MDEGFNEISDIVRGCGHVSSLTILVVRRKIVLVRYDVKVLRVGRKAIGLGLGLLSLMVVDDLANRLDYCR